MQSMEEKLRASQASRMRDEATHVEAIEKLRVQLSNREALLKQHGIRL